MSDAKSLRERMGRLGSEALAALIFVAGAGGGFLGGKSHAENQTKPAIATLEERTKAQQEVIIELKNNNEIFRGIVSRMGGHKSPLLHVLEELREHPPADAELEHILEGLSAQEHENAVNPVLDACCRSEYETIKSRLAEYKQSHNKDLGVRIQIGILWLHKGCGRKISEVSNLYDFMRRK